MTTHKESINRDAAYREYLMMAYSQNHPVSKEDWINEVNSLLGESLLFEVHKYMTNKYGCPKLGTSRVAYLSKFVVFKVPVSQDGFRDNDWEASLINVAPEGSEYHIPLAKSKHLPGHEIPIVVMEKIEEANLIDVIEKFGKLPLFVSAVDMGQVGWTRKGKLVAFDYADL